MGKLGVEGRVRARARGGGDLLEQAAPQLSIPLAPGVQGLASLTTRSVR